ncbi:hypothetical protein, conserved [Angomonas deanei]|uniref:Uncharacterized protein n=1 Tax=Angomonas deanei TaxID=59799 RepID=A0A7G2CFD5_9TRYP|nr:hypothetical protein, conserved [Angomonas deanei]
MFCRIPTGSFTSDGTVFVSPTKNGIKNYTLAYGPSDDTKQNLISEIKSSEELTPETDPKQEEEDLMIISASSSSASLFPSRASVNEEGGGEMEAVCGTIRQAPVLCAAVVASSPLVILLLNDYSGQAGEERQSYLSRQLVYVYDAAQGTVLAQIALVDLYAETLRVNKDYIVVAGKEQFRVIDLTSLSSVAEQLTVDPPNPHLILELSAEADTRVHHQTATAYHRIVFPYKESGLDRLDKKRGVLWILHIPVPSSPKKETFCQTIAAHQHAIANVCLNENGSLVVSASQSGQVLRLFASTGGNLLGEFRRGMQDSSLLAMRLESDVMEGHGNSLSGGVKVALYCLSHHSTIHVFRSTVSSLSGKPPEVRSVVKITLYGGVSDDSFYRRPSGSLDQRKNKFQLMTCGGGTVLWVAHYFYTKRTDGNRDCFMTRLMRYNLLNVNSSTVPDETLDIPYSDG